MRIRSTVTFALLAAAVSWGCGSDNKRPDAIVAVGKDAAQEGTTQGDGSAGASSDGDAAALPDQDAGNGDLAVGKPDGPASEPDGGAASQPDTGAPDAPMMKEVTNLRVQAGNAAVVLTWTDPSLADVVAVEIAWSPGGTSPVVVSRGAQLASIGSLQNGTLYTFTARTLDAAGNRSSGVSVSATPNAAALAEVTGLVARVLGQSVTLTWTSPANGAFDHVQITYSPGGVSPAIVMPPTHTQVLSSLPDGVYTFLVQTADIAGNLSSGVSVQAAVDTAAPSAGRGITFSNTLATSVTVSWGEASDNLTPAALLHYTLLRSGVGVDMSTVAAAEANGTVVGEGVDLLAADAPSLVQATTYQFVVIVQDALGSKSLYPPATVTTLETAAPTPGTSISFAAVTPNSVQVLWGAATDASTAVNTLEYKLVRAAVAADIDTIAEADAVGGTNLVMDWTANTTTSAATGLSQYTQYYFAVLVRNAGSVKALYAPAAVVTSGWRPADVVPPTAGQVISFGNVTGSSIVVNWGAATDDVTASANLTYKLVRADAQGTIDTVEKAESSGTLVMGWSGNVLTTTASGLAESTTYWFAVLVKDAAGNKALYAPTSAATQSTPPVPGNSGTIDVAGIQGTSLWLRWTGGTDDVSAKSALAYKVVSSTSNNLNDASTVESNGTTAMNWTLASSMAWQGASGSERIGVPITGLTATTPYYFNVIVKDAAGNKAVYTAKPATTGYDMAFEKVYANNQDGTQPSSCSLNMLNALALYKNSVYIAQAAQHPGGTCGDNSDGSGQLGYIDISGGVPAGIVWKMLSFGSEHTWYLRSLEISGDGNTIYVGSDTGVTAYDITTKSAPAAIANIAPSGGAYSMVRWADRLYIARNAVGLRGMSSYDLSSGFSAALTPEANWDNGVAGSYVVGLSVFGDATGVQLSLDVPGATGKGIYGLAIANATPTQVTQVWSDTSKGYSSSGSSLDGTYLWAASPTGPTLTAFDTSIPASTVARWSQANSNNSLWGGAVLVDGRFAYASNDENGITVFDISLPDFPVPVYSRNTHGDGDPSSSVRGVQRSGEYLYVATESYFLTYKLHNVDALAPTPGNSGTIATTASNAEVDLSWTAATDTATAPITATAQGSLEYRVYRGPSTVDLSTVRNVLEYGTAQGNWAQAMTSKAVTGLTNGTTYQFVVLVRDGWGNIGLYTAASATPLDAAPQASFPTGVTVSGAGTIAVNGTYTANGTQNGRPVYQSGSHYIYFNALFNEWCMSSTLNEGMGGTSPYVNGSSSNAVPVTGWSQQTGNAPAPTVSIGAAITGAPFVNGTLTANYNYSDAENDPEGATKVQWYRCANASDALAACTLVLDTTKPTLTYPVAFADVGSYLKVKITPVASSGTTTGTPITSDAFTQIRQFDSVKLFSESGSYPKMGMGAGGTIAVGYTAAGTIGVEYYDASSWQLLASPGNADQMTLQVEMDVTGRPVVFGSDQGDGHKAKLFDWNGTTWDALGFAASGINAEFAQMAMGSLPVVQVAVDQGGGTYHNHVFRWDSGTTWTDLDNPSNGASVSSSGAGSLALLSDGTLVSAFREDANYVDVATSTVAGIWTSIGRPLGNVSAHYPDLVIGGGNQIYIALQDNNGAVQVLQYNSGVTWDSLGSPGSSIYPRMGLTPGGNLFVVFTDTADSGLLKISFWTGGTSWTAPDLIGTTDQFGFDVATTGLSEIYVVFSDGEQSKVHLLKYNGTLPP